MYFQALDNKQDCYGFFYDGGLHRERLYSRTWRWSPNLDNSQAEFAYLYCGGLELSEVCPEDLKRDFQRVSDKMRAFLRSFSIAKVSVQEHCFYDLVPEKFLLHYFDLKNKITQHVFESQSKPANYDFLSELDQLTQRISQQPLKIDRDTLRSFYHLPSTRALIKALSQNRTSIDYNIFGTKTGRLATSPSSFPILTLKKELRSVLRPKNDWFVELDYNAAELRTLLALLGKEQPTGDIHEWNAKNVYGGSVTRDEAKQRIFAWLYNPESADRVSERSYPRQEALTQYWDGTKVKTPFQREIAADKHHALNYLVQSTSSDLFLRKVLESDKILQGRKTQIAYLLHDAVVFDFSMEDMDALKNVLTVFPQTKFGPFKINVSAGPDLGNMMELVWKQS